jgi:hypothetical protein
MRAIAHTPPGMSRLAKRFGEYVLAEFLVLLTMAACTSPERLSSKATPCPTKEIRIQASEFSRQGSTTAWCAECQGKLYQCVTNSERTRVQCHVAGEYDVCK